MYTGRVSDLVTFHESCWETFIERTVRACVCDKSRECDNGFPTSTTSALTFSGYIKAAETTQTIAPRRRKLDKYAAIKEKLEGNGYQVYLDAFVVGSLGTWDPENDHLLPVLGIGRKYGVLFKKLCCRDALAGSYEVWAARCRLHFQQSSSS